MAEHCHHVFNHHLASAVIYDRDIFVGSIKILHLRDGQRQRSRFVAGVFHLIYVPVCSEQRSVQNTYIRTDALNFLGVPQREGIVVSMGNKETVRTYRVEVVCRELDGSAPVRAVMVVPVLGAHDRGHKQAGGRHSSGNHRLSLTLQGLIYPLIDRGHREAYPDTEEIERARVSIVALTDLIRRLIQIQNNRDTGHKEHQESQPTSPLVAAELETQSEKTEKQR